MKNAAAPAAAVRIRATTTEETDLVAKTGHGRYRLIQQPVFHEAHDRGEEHHVVGLLQQVQARRRK